MIKDTNLFSHLIDKITRLYMDINSVYSSVGLDSEKRIVSEKMRKERKKRGKEAKRRGKEANLTS